MIVITAPTGNIGRQLLNDVLDSGKPIRVIARDPARLPANTRQRIDVVQGSHSDINVLKRAFEGAEAVFWLVPPDPRATSVDAAYVDFSRPACEAIKSQQVRRVVAVSALGRGTPVAGKAGLVTASLKMCDLIASTGAGVRALTMPSFIDNIIRQKEPIKRQGVFFGPISGERKAPACATRDIAAVAARLLLDSSWNGHQDAPVLGPEDLSFNDMANVMSDVLGKQVRYQQIAFEAYKAGFIERGMSEAMAQGMTDMAAAKSAGLDNGEPRTPQSTTPTSFRQWSEEVLKPAVLG
jgi:uncharacterized protein YbjT (DUF2867 family)